MPKDMFLPQNSNYDKYASVLSHLLLTGNDNVHPLISILMPVYNRPLLFKEALASAINQDFKFDYEIIIVDNNIDSTCNYEIVRSFDSDKIFYYKNEENIGMFGNWNRSIELAKASLITFLHDDDCLKKNALTVLYKLSTLIPPKSLIITDVDIIDADSNKTYSIPLKKSYHLVNFSLFDQIIDCRGMGPGCLFNREAMLMLGGYKNDYYPCSDVDLFMRYTQKYGCWWYSGALGEYRYAENESANCYKEMAQMLMRIEQEHYSYIFIPNFILRLISKANLNLRNYTLEKTFSNGSMSYGKPSLFYRLLSLSLLKYRKIKRKYFILNKNAKGK